MNLQNPGYEVTSIVSSEDDAIKKTEEDQPDLILMDIRIQGDKDGIKTAQFIREKFDKPINCQSEWSLNAFQFFKRWVSRFVSCMAPTSYRA